MNSINFLNLEPKEIGTITYYKKKKIHISEKEKLERLNSITNSYISMLIAKKSYGENIDLSNAFQYSRNHAKNHLENEEYQTIMVSIHYQIKNKNSYKELLDIEKSEDFISWTDESLIDRIKTNHNE